MSTERDRLSYEAEISYWKSLYRSEKQQKEDARSAWNELCETLEDAHMANSALTDERDALKAELARQGDAQAALVSLSKQYNLVWNERNEIAAMYHQALENAQAAQADMNERELATLDGYIPLADTPLAYRAPRRYRCAAPSAIYQPRVGRSRLAKHWAGELYQHRWFGGVTQRELMSLARHEGLYATHRELARLRAYAADWDDMSAQAENDCIPW